MIRYLIISQLALIALWGGYEFLLRKEKNHKSKRYYLLFSLVFSLVVPLVNQMSKIPDNVAYSWEAPVFEYNLKYVESSVFTDLETIVLLGYSIVAVIILLRMVLQVVSLVTLLKNVPHYPELNREDVFQSPLNSSFSWMGKIYLEQDLPAEVAKVILLHEDVHKRQWHVFDLIVSNLFIITFWFNPVVWLFKKRIEEVHENEADAIAAASVGSRSYQEILIAKALNVSPQILAHHFTLKSLLQNRIKMLNRTINPFRSKLKTALTLPVIIGMIVFAACSKDADTTSTAVDAEIQEELKYDIAPEYVGGQEALFKFLSNNLVYPEEAKNKGVEGTSYIAFTVNTDGSISDIHLARNNEEPSLDEEALAVIETMPDWQPAMKDGHPVAVEIKLPIMYRLSPKEKEEV